MSSTDIRDWFDNSLRGVVDDNKERFRISSALGNKVWRGVVGFSELLSQSKNFPYVSSGTADEIANMGEFTTEELKSNITSLLREAFKSKNIAGITKLADILDKLEGFFSASNRDERDITIEVVDYSDVQEHEDGVIQDYGERKVGKAWMDEAYELLSKVGQLDKIELMKNAGIFVDES